MAMLGRKSTPIEDKIVKAKDCFIWTAGTHAQGYPMMRDNGRMVLVSRYVMEKKLGYKLQKDQRVKNTCGNKLCVNPEHYILAEYGTEEWKCVRHFISPETRQQIRDEYNQSAKYYGQKRDLKEKYNIHYETLKKILAGN
tara:strand:- start:7921 stop:8340 length:420 start_codon:yes stop_codon:yes gene_type:complete